MADKTTRHYPHFGGVNPETAAVANVLAAHGVVAPHTREPYSEAFVLGAGGGLGGGYWVFEFSDSDMPPVVVLGARNDWQHSPGLFAGKTAQRLGMEVTVHESGGAKAAAAHLDGALAAGIPAIVAVDMASVPHTLMPPEQVKHFYHLLVVAGPAEDPAMLVIDDRARVALEMPRATLEAARAPITSMKRRLVTMAPTSTTPDLETLVRETIAECADGLLNPPIRNFGLAAWEKWGQLIAHPKDRKGWPAVFPPGAKLLGALTSSVAAIEASGNGPGLLRPLYADFLDEAATITGDDRYHDSAARYRALGAAWSDLARRLLPDEVPALGETRTLLLQRERRFRDHGAAAFDRMRAIDTRLDELTTTITDDWPLAAGDTTTLLADARARLLALHAAEREAAEELRHISHGNTHAAGER